MRGEATLDLRVTYKKAIYRGTLMLRPTLIRNLFNNGGRCQKQGMDYLLENMEPIQNKSECLFVYVKFIELL